LTALDEGGQENEDAGGVEGQVARLIAQWQQKMKRDTAEIVKKDKSWGEACGKSVEGTALSIWQLFVRVPW
jgi:hypothetical protein